MSPDRPQGRKKEVDYALLHEIARHALHVSETLAVASKSANDIQQQHRDFIASLFPRSSSWRRNYSPLQFPARTLESLVLRAESNKARLQNEIQLVSHRDHSRFLRESPLAYLDRHSTPLRSGTARSRCG